MSETKHTPGPWRAEHETCGKLGIPNVIRTAGGYIVAHVLTRITRRGHDARLIAAAPDLLEALYKLAKIGEDCVIERRETGKPTWDAFDTIKSIARDAIRKAQGE